MYIYIYIYIYIKSKKIVACSIIGSRLDYCNSLYVGMSESNFVKLQRVQNTLARVVTGHKRSDHITPVLADLHWLPVNSRVTVKSCQVQDRVSNIHHP